MANNWDKERKAAKGMTIAGSVFGILFAIVWCITATSMGAWFMLLFGIPFVGLMVYRLGMCIRLSKEDDAEASSKETDHWDRPAPSSAPNPDTAGEKFCPYCGSAPEETFTFCPNCGRRQP